MVHSFTSSLRGLLEYLGLLQLFPVEVTQQLRCFETLQAGKQSSSCTNILVLSSLPGEEVQQLCLEIMVTQAQSSQNAAALLGLWVTPPLLHGLSVCSN